MEEKCRSNQLRAVLELIAINFGVNDEHALKNGVYILF